jgi:hypothetical protein
MKGASRSRINWLSSATLTILPGESRLAESDRGMVTRIFPRTVFAGVSLASAEDIACATRTLRRCFIYRL